MFSTASRIAFLLLAVSVAANPTVVLKSPVSLAIVRRRNFNGAADLVQLDRARANNFFSIPKAKENGTSNPEAGFSVGATALASQGIYVAEVGVGSPPTQYSLIVDTGSSNTWVGAGKQYVKTKTSVTTGQRVNVTYGDASFFQGNEYLDTVTLASDLIIYQQSLGVATNSSDFGGVDGILGLGPSSLTIHSLSPGTNTTIATVTDNLFSQKTIGSDVVAISFEPATAPLDHNGEITFGSTDSTKFTGEITYVPRTTADSFAKHFWGIDQSIKYGDHLILSTAPGIVDTGTTLLLIATDAFERYKSLTGGILDNTTDMLEITNTQYNNLQPLIFRAGHRKFKFVPNAQIWPRTLNTYIGGKPGSIYLIVADIGKTSGNVQFVNGMVFLQRFYSVFDSTTGMVGLAPTNFTTATIN